MCIDSTRSEQVKTSVCRIDFDGSSAYVTLFSSRKIIPVFESFWLVGGHMHFNKGLQFFFMEIFDIDNISGSNLFSTTPP